MDEDGVNSGGREWKRTIRTIVIIVLMVTLVFITWQGYKLTETRNMKIKCSEHEHSYSYTGLLFGVFTVIFGFICVSIGLTIVVERVLGLFGWKQPDATENLKEKESTSNLHIFIHTIVAIVSMLMMAWAIYYGYKLSAEVHGGIIYNCLTFLMGVISMAFGIIYFIIGTRLLADSLQSSSSLHQAVSRDDALLDRRTDVKSTNDFCDL